MHLIFIHSRHSPHLTMPFPMMRIRMRIPSAGIFRLAVRHFLTTTTTTTTNLRIRLSSSSPAALNHHRHRTFALPFFHQQTSTYGRFAFKDVSSDESDLEFASSRPQQQQLVASYFHFLFIFLSLSLYLLLTLFTNYTLP